MRAGGQMKASVIVLAWNGREYLEACLSAVFAQDYPDFEVIVVDNGSTDGSADFVAERFPQARLIRNERNLGFAAGNNVGLRAATGDVLVLLNQDTQVRPGWLGALLSAFDDETVGIAGCKILYPDGRTLQHAGGYFEWPSGLSFHYGGNEEDQGQYDTVREVGYVTGAAMGIRRAVLETVGWLDEDFFPGYFEDTDLCYRARAAGYKVLYIPSAVLVHHESASFARTSVGKPYSVFRGRWRFILKHFTPQQVISEFIPFQKSRLPVMGKIELRALVLSAVDALLFWPAIAQSRCLGSQDTSVVIEEVRSLLDEAVLQERKTFS